MNNQSQTAIKDEPIDIAVDGVRALVVTENDKLFSARLAVSMYAAAYRRSLFADALKHFESDQAFEDLLVSIADALATELIFVEIYTHSICPDLVQAVVEPLIDKVIVELAMCHKGSLNTHHGWWANDMAYLVEQYAKSRDSE